MPLTCRWCGKEYTGRGATMTTNNFCSNKCYQEYLNSQK